MPVYKVIIREKEGFKRLLMIIINDKDYTTGEKKARKEGIESGEKVFEIRLGVVTTSRNVPKRVYDIMLQKVINDLQEYSVTFGNTELDVRYVLIGDANERSR